MNYFSVKDINFDDFCKKLSENYECVNKVYKPGIYEFSKGKYIVPIPKKNVLMIDNSINESELEEKLGCKLILE